MTNGELKIILKDKTFNLKGFKFSLPLKEFRSLLSKHKEGYQIDLKYLKDLKKTADKIDKNDIKTRLLGSPAFKKLDYEIKTGIYSRILLKAVDEKLTITIEGEEFEVDKFITKLKYFKNYLLGNRKAYRGPLQEIVSKDGITLKKDITRDKIIAKLKTLPQSKSLSDQDWKNLKIEIKFNENTSFVIVTINDISGAKIIEFQKN